MILNNQAMFVRYVPYAGNINNVKGANPDQARLNMYTAYRVIDINSYSDDVEAYLGIVNDYDQIFYLSNRYFRVIGFSDFVNESYYIMHDPSQFAEEDGCPPEMYEERNPDHLYFQRN
jgi:hypothetical protein